MQTHMHYHIFICVVCPDAFLLWQSSIYIWSRPTKYKQKSRMYYFNRLWDPVIISLVFQLISDCEKLLVSSFSNPYDLASGNDWLRHAEDPSVGWQKWLLRLEDPPCRTCGSQGPRSCFLHVWKCPHQCTVMDLDGCYKHDVGHWRDASTGQQHHCEWAGGPCIASCDDCRRTAGENGREAERTLRLKDDCEKN